MFLFYYESMSFSIGIVGLPNVGKSTLFKALTKHNVSIAPRAFTTIKPNIGLVAVPDQRLEKISQTIKPEKTTPAFIEFVDIAGLIKNAHKGEGLGNQFLGQIRNCQAIIKVIRVFENIEAENIAQKIDPENEVDIIRTELELKDLESKEKENLLAKKPVVYLLNTDNKTQFQPLKANYLTINLKEELETADLTEQEKQELNFESKLDQIVNACYNVLDLVTFFTIVGFKETKAWPIKKESTACQAAEMVHSDFKNFIKAETINWQKLVEINDWKKAKQAGQIKTVGRDYLIQDGDVIEFKI